MHYWSIRKLNVYDKINKLYIFYLETCDVLSERIYLVYTSGLISKLCNLVQLRVVPKDSVEKSLVKTFLFRDIIVPAKVIKIKNITRRAISKEPKEKVDMFELLTGKKRVSNFKERHQHRSYGEQTKEEYFRSLASSKILYNQMLIRKYRKNKALALEAFLWRIFTGTRF